MKRIPRVEAFAEKVDTEEKSEQDEKAEVAEKASNPRHTTASQTTSL